MAGLLEALGFDPVKSLVTVINFLLVFWILKKALFGRLLKVLEERRKKIEEGLARASEAEKILSNSREEAESVLAQARAEAEKTALLAEEARDALLREARSQAEEIVKKSQGELENAKAQVRAEMAAQLIDLVSLAVRKVLDDAVGLKEQHALVERAVSRVLEETYP